MKHDAFNIVNSERYRGGLPMGKRSKAVKRALPKAYRALREIAALTEIYYNDTKFSQITKIAKAALPK